MDITWFIFIGFVLVFGYIGKKANDRHIHKMRQKYLRETIPISPEEMKKLHQSKIIIDEMGLTFDESKTHEVLMSETVQGSSVYVPPAVFKHGVIIYGEEGEKK